MYQENNTTSEELQAEVTRLQPTKHTLGINFSLDPPQPLLIFHAIACKYILAFRSVVLVDEWMMHAHFLANDHGAVYDILCRTYDELIVFRGTPGERYEEYWLTVSA
tara:strand:- start:1025 stop:1345 length:321 start_codon:yes stop_codon:yes gene_type:complete